MSAATPPPIDEAAAAARDAEAYARGHKEGVEAVTSAPHALGLVRAVCAGRAVKAALLQGIATGLAAGSFLLGIASFVVGRFAKRAVDALDEVAP